MNKIILTFSFVICLFYIGKSQNVIGNGGFEYNSFPNGNAFVYVDPINSNPNDYMPCWTFGCPNSSANPPSWPNTPTVITATTQAPHSGDYCASMYRTYGATGTNSRNQVLKFHNDCSPTLQYFAEGDYQLSVFVRGIAWCPTLSDGSGFSMNARLRKDYGCSAEKYIGMRAVPVSANWTELIFCFTVEPGEVYNEVEFFQTHETGVGEHHIQTLVDDVSMCLIGDVDISHLDGQVCTSDAVIEIPKGIGYYKIEVELAFQGVVCTIIGNGPGSVNIFDHCGLVCDPTICYQVKIIYERCGRYKIATALPHFVCGPKAKAYASPGVICVGDGTTLIAQGCQPSNYIYEWFNTLNPSTPIGQGCFKYVVPTVGGGSYYLKVTDPTTLCSNTDGVLIGWKICNKEKHTRRSAKPGSEDIEVNIYPNPANAQLFLSREGENLSGGTIQIVNTKGSVVRQQDFTPNDEELSFYTGDIAPGIYFTQVIIEGQIVKFEKVIIAH